MNTVELSNACVEINEILKHSPIEFRLKCPIKIKSFFNDNDKFNYVNEKNQIIKEWK